ncbi:MAG: DsrE/DsrF/DrsH-like family protein [Mogibacterium sp.]|nr:DsrE/DsrF/DrsH-like family protein [Mogibacterium sp.]
MKKIVIVGGVAGGASCAARLRRLDEEAHIVLMERGEYISYANCGLPYHIGDVIKSRESLLVSTPEMMKDRFRIDVRTGNEVISINRKGKSVRVRTGDGQEYDEPYDELVLSTGSSPLKPKIPGIESELIQTLWTVPDTDRIRGMALKGNISTAAVIGGGFIGLEVAENLHRAGLRTVLVEAADQVMPPVDRELAQLLHEHITDQGVELHLGDGVASFKEITEDGKKKIRITLASGKTVVTEFVVLSIGLRPNSQLAKDAGLELNEKGGVRVDRLMRTSDESIYAVGDIAEIEDFTTGDRMQYQLAGPANKEGRIAANNICGAAEEYGGTQGTSIAKVWDLAVGMTGKSEKALAAAGKVKGKDYDTIIITQNHHAGYYPGAQPLTIKVIFTHDGSRILGAQIVGAEGVDKRIDVISTAARLGAKATDLAKLELTYAPPYSSAKDPVNMAGFVIRNVLDGLVKFAEWDVLESGGEIQVLDVREDAERMAFELPGSINIPLGRLRDRMNELDTRKPVVVFCSIGVRSYSAARVLMQNGFEDVRVYPAGTRFYRSTHYENFTQIPESTENGGPVMSTDKTAMNSAASADISMRLDCSGMQCPGPILKVYEGIQKLEDGQTLEVRASDPGFAKDVVAWCRRTGNSLIYNSKEGFDYVARIRKGTADNKLSAPNVRNAAADQSPMVVNSGNDGKTIIVFSGDMDKVMASFIIANGAAALGKKVTMFFTFWGLSVLRKPDKMKVDKSPMEKMFGAMLPRGAEKLKISKMNMGGMGTLMMKKIMKDKNVNTLEELIKSAMDNGVKIVACTMSMDVMGIKPEELIDGVELGGVGYYLGDAEESNVNLFI